MRIHKKRDGFLMIKDDGEGRFMTFVERVKYKLFGKVPKF